MHGARPHILAGSLLICACSPDVETTTGSASSTDGPAGTTTDEPQPTTTGDPPPGGCASVQGDHAAAVCPGGTCPIAVDIEVRCDVDRFGAPGLRVGAAPDTTWLVTSSDSDSLLFRVDAGGAERITGVVEPYPHATIQLAVDPDGAPHLTVDNSSFKASADYPGGLVHIWRDGETWTETVVFDPPDFRAPATELAVDGMGRPHVFFASMPPNVYSAAVRDGGTWTTHEIATPEADAYNRFSLTAAGQEIAYALLDGQVVALVEGETVKLGPPLYSFEYRVADPAPVGPDLVASVELPGGLTVVWASLGAGPAPGRVDIPGSAAPELTCGSTEPGPDVTSCPPPCHELAVGTDERSHAFARTADGVGWIAWVVTHRDIVYRHELSDFNDISSYCKAVVQSDKSTGELHLARVPLDGGPPEEVLMMPLPVLAGISAHLDTPAHAIDLRSAGSELALALRLGKGGGVFIRVLRLDSAAFE